MRTDRAAVIDTPAAPRASETSSNGLRDELVQFWRDFVVAAFNPYRPERHYMRGPGPAWHAKHRSAQEARPSSSDAGRG